MFLSHLRTPDPDPSSASPATGHLRHLADLCIGWPWNPGASRSRKSKSQAQGTEVGSYSTEFGSQAPGMVCAWGVVSRWQLCVSSASWNIEVSCHPPLSPPLPLLKPLPFIGSPNSSLLFLTHRVRGGKESEPAGLDHLSLETKAHLLYKGK